VWGVAKPDSFSSPLHLQPPLENGQSELFTFCTDFQRKATEVSAWEAEGRRWRAGETLPTVCSLFPTTPSKNVDCPFTMARWQPRGHRPPSPKWPPDLS
jgi:hypothetical protein